MSKKGLKKLGASIKKFSKSKVGKVLKVAALVGGGIALGVATGGAGAGAAGLLAKGTAGGGKKLLGFLGSAKKIKAAKNGLTSGDTAKKPGLLKGLFGRKKAIKKGVGGARVDEEDKPRLLQQGVDELTQKIKKHGIRSKKQKEAIAEVAQSVNEEVKKDVYSDSRDIVNGDQLQSMAAGAPERNFLKASVDTGADAPEDKAQTSDTLKKVGIGVGALGLLYGVAKVTGIVK